MPKSYHTSNKKNKANQLNDDASFVEFYSTGGNIPSLNITLQAPENLKVASKNYSSPVHYISKIRKRVTKKSLEKLMKETSLSLSEMAGIMDMNETQMTNLNATGKLDQNQSEKAVLIEKLYKRGTEIFEGDALFKAWMNSKVIALGNKKPKTYLDTIYGINMVADEIERLAYGVYS